MRLLSLLLLVFIAYGDPPSEYKLLKRFKETKDEGIALFLLDNYPEAVFSEELKVELAEILVQKGKMKRAERVLSETDLTKVRDEYGERVVRLWKKTSLDPKPLVLRFPELTVDMLEGVDLSEEERRQVARRLLRKRRFEEVLKLTDDCLLRGIALFRMRRYGESLHELRDCPQEEAQLYALLSYIHMKDIEGARRFVRERDSQELYFRLGWEMLSRGEYEEARQLFLYSGDSFKALFYAGLVDFIKGRYLLAYEEFSEAQKLSKDSLEKGRVYFWKFKTLERLGFKDIALHYLRLASQTEGFYSAVARRLLGKRVYDKPNLDFPPLNTGLADRLISIYRLGFLHYMRLEAFKRAEELTPADLFKLVQVDPYTAIKVAARNFGANSDIYRAIAFPTPFGEAVHRASKRFKVDPALIYAVMRQEGLFDPKAVSPSGAKGLMQLLESTARWQAQRIGMSVEDIYDVETNVTLGVAYLRYLLDLWRGNVVRAVASYNAGQGAVSRWIDYRDDLLFIETIPYDETRNYVKRVLWFYYVYSELLLR